MVELDLSVDDYSTSGFEGSNALILPSTKKVQMSISKETKKKPLSSKRRKKLEKKEAKREKAVERQSILAELKNHQLTDTQRKQMISVVASNKKSK